MDQHYDVIIIGTGAGGGTLAYCLASSGKRILLWSAVIFCHARNRTGMSIRSFSTTAMSHRKPGTTTRVTAA